MPIYVKREKSDYSTAPEGLHQGVCIDVIDLGIVKTTYKDQTKEKHMVRIRWALDEIDPKSGKDYWVSRRFNLSLHEKADLCKMLQTWRGKPFTDVELEQFDIETVIGANCQIQIQHNIKDKSTTYANVVAVVPLGKGMPKMAIPADYVRECDREHMQDLEQNPDGNQLIEDDDIPF